MVLKKNIRPHLLDYDDDTCYTIWQMHNLLELIKKEQNIYNTVFHEVIRQVRVTKVHKTILSCSVYMDKKHFFFIINKSYLYKVYLYML